MQYRVKIYQINSDRDKNRVIFAGSYSLMKNTMYRKDPMTSEERREARYRRRVAARLAKKEKYASCNDFSAVFSYGNAVSDLAAKPFVPMVLSALGGEFLVPERLRAECSDAVGSNLFMRTYERDEVLEEYILEEAEKFWKNHVEKHIPPSLENEKGAKALATLNKYTQGFHAATPVMMPHEERLADCYRQMTELSERKSALSKRSKELDAQIKKLSVPFVEALNGADRGQFFYDGSSYEVAYASGERIGIPKKKYAVLQNAFPDAYDAVVEKSVTSPTLKVKKH